MLLIQRLRDTVCVKYADENDACVDIHAFFDEYWENLEIPQENVATCIANCGDDYGRCL